MKRILFAIVMFAFSTVLMPGMSLVDSDNTKTRIETRVARISYICLDQGNKE